MMVQKRLQLFMMRGAGSKARLTFKTGEGSFTIERLCNALQFVANMEQLRRAINGGGGKQSWIEMLDGYGKEWVLECRCVNRVVGLDLWYQHPGFEDHLQTDFSWEGGIGEFEVAVHRLVALLGKNQ